MCVCVCVCMCVCVCVCVCVRFVSESIIGNIIFKQDRVNLVYT